MSEKPNDLFLGLVASLQMSAWIALGKIVSPMTQKVERDIEQAKETIDLLGMLEEKTRGNLHPDEARLLERMLYELRLNYVDEMKSGPTATVDAGSGTSATSGTSGTSGTSATNATHSEDAPPKSAGAPD